MSIEGNVENAEIIKISGKVTTVPKTDDTLTKAGYAADAKVVGEKLAVLEEKMDEVLTSLGSGE